ncbi:helix-turn-helix domain-containing protein [Streptomyces sp. NPDC059255]|uniref:helix-turn-helix domain-containing protein n=1 Tax=Streptomyces sp. NPDC059255 TaxID=3346793 RepID=UPI0036B3B36D
MRHIPVVRRQRLGEELRRLRRSAGLTSGQTARLLGWHQSKVSRIETGVSGVRDGDLAALLDALGIEDQRLRSLLRALAGTADGTGWWTAYSSVIPPTYRDFIALESQASTAHTLETSVVPGLLQTSSYARAVTRAALTGKPDGTVDSLVDVRLTRQEVLTRDESPLRLHAVVDEAVLRREVGGPGVMRDQLRRLTRLARLPQICLQVLPFTAGGYAGLTGPFVIFSFPNITDLDLVILDHLTNSLYLERKEDLEAYRVAFDAMRAHALSTEDSSDLIAGISDGA